MGRVDQTPTRVRLLEPLTSFRFIAALLVFQWHTRILSSYLDKYELGYVGVSFFFILSGFILTYVYTSRLGSGKRSKIKSFYAARVAKLYPVHLLTFMLAFPLAVQSASALFSTHVLTKLSGLALLNLTLTQSFYPLRAANFSFNGVAWSISDEMFFYTLFPLLIYLVVRYRKAATLRRLFIAWFIVWAALIAYLATKQSDLDNWIYYVFPPLRLLDFVSGMLLGLTYLKLTQTSENVFDRLRPRHFTFLEVAAAGVLVTAIVLSPSLPQPLRFGMFLIPFWGLLIFTFAWQRGVLSRILSVRPLVFLGKISFSFYMIHQLIIKSLAPATNIGHHAIISLVISLSAATIIYIFFEEPHRVSLKAYLEQLTLPVIPRWLRLRVPRPVREEQPAPSASASPSVE